MEALKVYQQVLEETYPSLTMFSDIDWQQVSYEYIATHEIRPTMENFTLNFPQYLQKKAEEGDCPTYLFELAYYDLAQNQLEKVEFDLPKDPGIYLNPTAAFLNFEFDIKSMIDEANKGKVQVKERAHVLCLYAHPSEGLHEAELDQASLEVLAALENSQKIQSDQKVQETFQWLVQIGLILNIT